MSLEPTIAATLARRAKDDPDRVAFAFGDEALTNRQLLGDSQSIAAALASLGYRRGDRVAIAMPAGLDLLRLFYALQWLGAVTCILDPNVPAEAIDRRAAGIQAAHVLRAIPVSACSAPVAAPHDDEHALAFLQPTSGTSGEPLAAMVRQRNVLASIASSRDLIDPGPSDVFVSWVPPWHDLGLLRFVLAPVFFGLPCHLVTPAVRTIPEWLATIDRVRGTLTGAPDFAWKLATRLGDPQRVRLSTLRFATNGGEPVRRSTIEAFEKRFDLHDVIRPGYGLAEATLGVASTRSGEPLRVDERGNVSCGRPLRDVEVRIENDEILVRGPAVFAGYFDAPEATARALRDGWLHTGDSGSIDAEGNLYVFGRQRTMIKRGGVALAPRELEEAAHSVPGVRLAAAIGVPSAFTEQIVVVVEADTPSPSLEQEVAAAVTRAIGTAPDRVVVQGPRTIPRTYNGKIRHAVLRDQLAASNILSSSSDVSAGD